MNIKSTKSDPELDKKSNFKLFQSPPHFEEPKLFPIITVEYYEDGQKLDLNVDKVQEVRKVRSTRDYRMKLRPQIVEIEKDLNVIRKNNFLNELTSLLH